MCITPLTLHAAPRGTLDEESASSSDSSTDEELAALAQANGSTSLLPTRVSTPSPGASEATYAGDEEGRERLMHLLSSVSDDSLPESGAGSVCAARSWCNFMYAGRCPFFARGCRYVHLDTYFLMDNEQRCGAAPVANIMQKHKHGLMRDMMHTLTSRARAVLEAHVVSSVWNNGEGTECMMDPYAETVEKLRSIGWVVPSQDPSAAFTRSMNLEDAPYAKDVAAIVQLCVQCVYFQINDSSICAATISWVLGLVKREAGIVHGMRADLVVNDLVATPVEYDLGVPVVLPALPVRPQHEQLSGRQRHREEYVAKQRANRATARAARMAKREARAVAETS